MIWGRVEILVEGPSAPNSPSSLLGNAPRILADVYGLVPSRHASLAAWSGPSEEEHAEESPTPSAV